MQFTFPCLPSSGMHKKWRHSSYYRDFAVFPLAPRFSWVLLISVFPTDGRKVGKLGILNPKHVYTLKGPHSTSSFLVIILTTGICYFCDVRYSDFLIPNILMSPSTIASRARQERLLHKMSFSTSDDEVYDEGFYGIYVIFVVV